MKILLEVDLNTLYRSGIASKQKDNAISSALSMCSDGTGVHRKHITFMKNTPVPKLFTYKNLLQRINQIDIGEFTGKMNHFSTPNFLWLITGFSNIHKT